MRFGDSRVTGCAASFDTVDWCFVQDGNVYLAIHPLLVRQQDITFCSTRFLHEGPYRLIAWYNMCRFEARPVNSHELRGFGSGIVLEVGAVEQYGAFEDFIACMRESTIVHDQFGTERFLRYQREGVELELWYDYAQLNLRRALVNGQLVSETTALTTTPHMPLVT